MFSPDVRIAFFFLLAIPSAAARFRLTVGASVNQTLVFSNASVRMKREFELEAGSENYEHYRQNWENDPWFVGMTGDDSLATVAISYTAIDGSGDITSPKSRDWISAHRFVIQVSHRKSETEEFTIVLNDGNSVAGKHYNVVVESVGDPVYVPTN